MILPSLRVRISAEGWTYEHSTFCQLHKRGQPFISADELKERDKQSGLQMHTAMILTGQLNITRDQAIAQIAQASFLKVPATVQDTANAAVLIASDRARMMTGTVVNATAGAALD